MKNRDTLTHRFLSLFSMMAVVVGITACQQSTDSDGEPQAKAESASVAVTEVAAAKQPAAPATAAESQLPDGWAALPETAPVPEDNPTTDAKIELGKQLFFDPRLSHNGTVSCNSCHNVMEGGDDCRSVGMGILGRTGARNSPTVWNAAFMPCQFWDGRAASLEEQAGGPMVANPEMGMASHDVVMERIKAVPGYVEEFEKVFGKDSMTIDNATKAIAAFERTLITPNSPYDRYAKGEVDALTEQQVRGMQLFEQVGCSSCHEAPLFGGDFYEFPSMEDEELMAKYAIGKDNGREAATGDESDRFQFKTPTLRNVTITAPYLHNGSAATLEEAVRLMGTLQLGEDLTKEQVADLVAFLGSLEGEFPAITLPRIPSTPGTTIVPADTVDVSDAGHGA